MAVVSVIVIFVFAAFALTTRAARAAAALDHRAALLPLDRRRPPSLPCRRHPDATTIAARATAATFAATPPPITARAAMALASALSRPLPVILWPTAVPPPPSSASIPLSPLPPPSSTVPHCHHPRRTTATFAARALGATTVSGVTSSSPSRRSRPACSKPCCGAHGQPRRRTHPPSVATNGSCRT